MRLIAKDGIAWSVSAHVSTVCMTASVLVTTVNHAKTDEVIEMPMRANEPSDRWVVHIVATWQMRWIDLCATAMRSVATVTVVSCCYSVQQRTFKRYSTQNLAQLRSSRTQQRKSRGAHRIFFQGGHRRWKGSVVGWHHGECGARAYNGGPGAEPLVRASGGRSPLKLKAFWSLDVQRSRQI